MTSEVSIRLPERVWREMVEYAPPGVGLTSSIRTQLQAATTLTDERPARLDFRIATLKVEDAHELQTWLTTVSRRSDAPAGAGVALAAVNEGLRLAE